MLSGWLLIETGHFISPPSAAGLTPQLLSQSPVISRQMRRSKGAVPDVIHQKQKLTKGKWGRRDDGVRKNELKFQLVQVQHQFSDCGDYVKSESDAQKQWFQFLYARGCFPQNKRKTMFFLHIDAFP